MRIEHDTRRRIREWVDEVPDRSGDFEAVIERGGRHPARRPALRNGLVVAGLSALMVLAAFLPTSELFDGSSKSLELAESADVVFEAEGWIVGLREEAIPGSNNINFCWEFVSEEVAQSSEDLTGCRQRPAEQDGVSISWTGPQLKLPESTVFVLELRPGSGGQVKTRSGRGIETHQGQRMPLSGADVFVVESPEDHPFDILTFVPAFNGIESIGSVRVTSVQVAPDDVEGPPND